MLNKISELNQELILIAYYQVFRFSTKNGNYNAA